jgi:hypothetical protein
VAGGLKRQRLGLAELCTGEQATLTKLPPRSEKLQLLRVRDPKIHPAIAARVFTSLLDLGGHAAQFFITEFVVAHWLIS